MGGFYIAPINFDEPRPWANYKSVTLGLPISFMTLAWICIVNRLYIRYYVVHSPGWDDLFVLLYAAMTTAGTVSIAFAVSHGFGEHFLTLTVPEMSAFLTDFYIGNAAYTSSTTFIKLALLCQYMRVFDKGTFMRKMCIYMAVVVGLWGLAYSILAWIPCYPVRDYWNILSTDTCYGFGSRDPDVIMATYGSHTATNMVFDLIILGMPFTLFFAKDATTAQRVRLLILLFVGSWIIAFAGWRLYTISQTRAATYPTFDPTWYAPVSVILAVLEVDCAAICASMPIFWPQISKALWGEIVVVKEVQITRETRQFEYEDDSALTNNYLTRVGSSGSGDHLSSFKDLEAGGGGGGAVRQVDRGDGINKNNKSKGKPHFEDSYALRDVAPFRKKTGAGVPQVRPAAELASKRSEDDLRKQAGW